MSLWLILLVGEGALAMAASRGAWGEVPPQQRLRRELPRQIPGLTVWWNADWGWDASTGQWFDRSRRGWTATAPAEANRPAVSGQLYNGHRALAFSVDDRLELDGALSYEGDDPRTIIGVFVPSAVFEVQISLNQSQSDEAPSVLLVTGTDAGGGVTRVRYCDDTGVLAMVCKSQVIADGGLHLTVVLDKGDSLRYRADGIEATADVDSRATITQTVDYLIIGARAGSPPTSYFNGNLTDLLFYDRRLTDAEVARLEGWFNQRYAMWEE